MANLSILMAIIALFTILDPVIKVNLINKLLILINLIFRYT